MLFDPRMLVEKKNVSNEQSDQAFYRYEADSRFTAVHGSQFVEFTDFSLRPPFMRCVKR